MKLRIVVTVLLLALVALVGAGSVAALDVVASADACVPNANQVAVYQHNNYGGQCVLKGNGVYPNPAAMSFPDNTVSSVKVGANVRLLLYRDANLVGVTSAFTANDPMVGNDSIGDNTVSSFRVEPRAKNSGCAPGVNQIALFEHENYGGRCVVKNNGNYTNSYEIGLPDNFISSVKVGANMRLLLFRNGGYGPPETAEARLVNDPSIYYDPIGNDTVSSVMVQFEPKNGGCVPAARQIAVFEAANYGGKCVIHTIGNYGNAFQIGLADNTISSVKVAGNTKVTMYQGPWFGDKSETFAANDANLVGNYVGNDTVSAMKVLLK